MASQSNPIPGPMLRRYRILATYHTVKQRRNNEGEETPEGYLEIWDTDPPSVFSVPPYIAALVWRDWTFQFTCDRQPRSDTYPGSSDALIDFRYLNGTNPTLILNGNAVRARCSYFQVADDNGNSFLEITISVGPTGVEEYPCVSLLMKRVVGSGRMVASPGYVIPEF